MKLPIHFLAIGSELVQGKIQDANGRWLGKFLSNRGLALKRISILPDDEKALSEFFKNQELKSQFFVISGGLGPTKDDKTKSFLSKLTNCELTEDENALKLAKAQYQRYQKEFDIKRTGYHLIPSGWEALANPVGLAPSLYSDQFRILALPGVPREFEAVIQDQADRLFPVIKNQNQQLSARIFGVSEEKIFFEKAPKLWEELEKLGQVSCLPHFPYVDIGISGNNLDNQAFQSLIKDSLQDEIINFEGLHAAEIILDILKEKQQTLAIAESCTGGLCSSLLTDISGASKVYLGSVTSYSNQVKMNSLDVSSDTIEQHTVYSHQVAQEMAKGVSQALESHIGLSTTGIAGPDGGSKNNPVGRVYIGVCINGETTSFSRDFIGSRKQLKQRFADFAFLSLLRSLYK